MKCKQCEYELTEGLKICPQCGTVVEQDAAEVVDPAPTPTAPQQQQKKSRWLLSILEIALLVIVSLVVKNKWLIPSVIPERLWEDTLQAETRTAVVDYLNENYIYEASVQFSSVEIQCETFEPDDAFTALIVSNLEDSDKQLYRYILTCYHSHRNKCDLSSKTFE